MKQLVVRRFFDRVLVSVFFDGNRNPVCRVSLSRTEAIALAVELAQATVPSSAEPELDNEDERARLFHEATSSVGSSRDLPAHHAELARTGKDTR